MTSKELQDYIYKNIPILEANNLTVGKINNYCPEICGQHKNHINHRSTVFGGTLSMTLTTAAWSQLRLIMISEDINAGSVIAKQTVEFRIPVSGDFKAISTPLSNSEIKKLKCDLKEKGQAKVNIISEIYMENNKMVLAKFTGEFVVFYEK